MPDAIDERDEKTEHEYYLASLTHAVPCRCDICLDVAHSHHMDENEGGTYTTCPACMLIAKDDRFAHRESQFPIFARMPCYACEMVPNRRLTGKTNVVNKADPTTIYELECGHWTS